MLVTGRRQRRRGASEVTGPVSQVPKMGGETEVTEVVVNQLGGRTPRRRKFLMPQGTPFHGLIPPFPIRVDQFGALPGLTAVPALHLLSHTHTDHTLGLSAKSFASTIICSHDAKQMLLRHEVYGERALSDIDLRDEARLSRTFGHLKVPPFLKDGRLDFSATRDLLVCYPYI